MTHVHVRVSGDKELAKMVAQIVWARLKFLDVKEGAFTMSALRRYPTRHEPDDVRIYFTVSKP